MSEISANILIPILTAIVGAVVGALFQNLLVPPTKNYSVINNDNGIGAVFVASMCLSAVYVIT